MIRTSTSYDLPQITIVRTSVRENHLSVAQLAERGITEQSIAVEMVSGDLGCWVAEAQGTVVGFSKAHFTSAFLRCSCRQIMRATDMARHFWRNAKPGSNPRPF
jgi:hypothetical protein